MPASSFSALFGTSRESSNVLGIAVNAVRSGFAVIPIQPGDKKPMCTLTENQRKSANKKVRDEAKAAGRRDWNKAQHACGVHEAIDTESRAQSVFKRMLAEHPDLNLAIEVGKSRVLVVDADTEAEVDGFTQYWGDQAQAALLDQGIPHEIAAAAGESIRRVLPTVVSPGKISDESGEWVHKNGGHFYFRLPEGIDFSSAPAARGLKLPGGAMAYVKDRAILVPPSVRPEGAYVLGSDISDAPEWLVGAVTETVTDFYARKALQAEKIKDADDPITVWSAATPWRELLEPAGWGETHRFESCGCPSWLRPGEPASDKSAVAHEDGCTRFDDLDGGFLHLWSDNAYPDYRDRRGTRNMTKLDFVTYEEHGRVDEEVTKATKSLLGLYRDDTLQDLLGSTSGAAEELVREYEERSAPAPTASLTIIEDEITVVDEDEEVDEGPETGGLPLDLLDARDLDDIPPPVWLVKGWVTADSLARISGSPGSWKSFLALDLACCVASGKSFHDHRVKPGRVLYVAAEGVSGMKKRVRAWEKENETVIERGRLQFHTEAINATDKSEWAKLVATNIIGKYDLVILDTQARMTAGMDENDNSVMGVFIDRMNDVRLAAGSCVLAIHHSGHGQKRGRGATAMWAGLDSEMFLDRNKETGVATLSFIKSKDSDDDLDLHLKSKRHVMGVDEDGEDVTTLTLYRTEVTEQGVDYWAEVLLNMGVPDSAGFPTCAKALREAGFKVGDHVLKEVVRLRKQVMTE